MIYEEFPPSPALASVVSSYWRFALSASTPPTMLHVIPPDGAVNLCWLPPGRAVLLGPRVTALRVPVQAGSEYLGVRFLPGAAGPLLGIEVTALRDKVAPLPEDHELAVSFAALFTGLFAASRRNSDFSGLDALVQHWLGREGCARPDPAVTEIARRIVNCDGVIPVSALVAGLNLSYRQTLRRFYRASGITPKEFARLRRMRAACLQAVQSAKPGWAGVSASAGFSDQSHLVREFNDIYGWPPRLVHEYLRQIEHVNAIQ